MNDRQAPSPLVGLLTIGQSPRPDLCGAILRALSAHVPTIQAGLLDGLSDEAVAQDFAPVDGKPPFITKLASGRSVELNQDAVDAGMQSAVDALEARGATAIVLLCTGSFPHLRTRRAWLIEPDGLLTAIVGKLLRDRPLGVMAPLAEQIPLVRAKWAGLPHALHCEAASPYGPIDALIPAAQALCRQGAQFIVLDCMGYGEQHKQALVAAGIAVPVLVSAEAVASAIAPLF